MVSAFVEALVALGKKRSRPINKGKLKSGETEICFLIHQIFITEFTACLSCKTNNNWHGKQQV